MLESGRQSQEQLDFIQIKDLKKYFPRGNIFTPKKLRYVKAIDGITLTLAKGKITGIVGESGCGKSTLGRLLVGADAPTHGKILFENKDITKFKGKELLKFRQTVQYVFQDPYTSLNPKMRIRRSISEPLMIRGVSLHEINDRLSSILKLLSLNEDLLDKYPSLLSGGQLQRFALARALLVNPELIICDEVVSALDVSIQAQMLNLLYQIQVEKELTLLFVSHDLSVINFISDQVAVMYLGTIVEMGPTKDVFQKPLHPYTNFLISALPKTDVRNRRSFKNILTGEVPSPIDPPSGCRFRTRCPKAEKICAEQKPLLKELDNRKVACFFV